jgi:phosphatidylserine/phosphatidylglycerophosphate/cardiolipin synthase-like enzyme
MRFKSTQTNGYQVFAVSGVNTVSFGIAATDQARRGLLGFTVERYDPTENERYVMPGYKVFRSVVPQPDEDLSVSTFDHPVQSFVWDDFTAKPDREYEYTFFPLRGRPRNLDRTAAPVPIRVRTEPLFSNRAHDVFFNRGVASSQAYRRRFGNRKPSDLPAEEGKAALQWLTRELDDAVLRFIENAEPGDTLLGCFYEFRYAPVADALKAAIDRGVDVRLIIDGKVNERTDKNGVFHESFPREDNLRTLKAAKIPRSRYKLREAKPNNIQHNKFLVLVRNGTTPAEVWTGSTNLSVGGFSGQTNVGHWARDPELAKQFVGYWELLHGDPGAGAGLPRSEALKANRALHAAVASLREVATSKDAIGAGVASVFSPRAGLDLLNLYADLVDSAGTHACITLAFGIGEVFKKRLVDNPPTSHLVLMLLEKRDRPNARSRTAFVPINASNNVYQAWGSYIEDPVYQWARETNAKVMGVNQHVVYVHSKFLLVDPLSADPIVITGSANFSKASTNDNDENMLFIRGDTRVADIYFTEFNRLFNHYYFRSVLEVLAERGPAAAVTSDSSLFLAENDKWTDKYKPGTFRTKRLGLITGIHNAQTLALESAAGAEAPPARPAARPGGNLDLDERGRQPTTGGV